MARTESMPTPGTTTRPGRTPGLYSIPTGCSRRPGGVLRRERRRPASSAAKQHEKDRLIGVGFEVEADRQHVGFLAVGQRAERLGVARGLDRALGVEIEGEIARAGNEPDVAHRAVPQNEKAELREAALLAELRSQR